MKKQPLQAVEIALFAMFGSLMFLTKYLMQALPNIHLLAMFIAAFTIVYRWKALTPLYVYVLIDGVVGGFAMWWVPYLYIWLTIWGAVMLAAPAMERRQVSAKKQAAVYMALCALHGLTFGAMYAPLQALMYGLNFKAMLAWIAAGLWFDALHGAGNFVAGALVLPLAGLLRRLGKYPLKKPGAENHGEQV
jgi:energy-coupling factor transport system substrate-specific component